MQYGTIVSYDSEQDIGIIYSKQQERFLSFSSDNFGKVVSLPNTPPTLHIFGLGEHYHFNIGQKVVFIPDTRCGEVDIAVFADYQSFRIAAPNEYNTLLYDVETYLDSVTPEFIHVSLPHGERYA